MSVPKLFFLSAILTLAVIFTAFSSFSEASDCDNWEIKENITRQDNGLITLEIEVKNSASKLHYVFFGETGSLLSQDFDSNTVQDLQPGNYEYVIAGKGCRVHNEIILE